MLNNEDTPLFFHFKKMAKHYYDRFCKELGDTDIDRYYVVLMQICKYQSVTQQYLSNSLGTDKTSMVRIIDYLNKHGYVTRGANPVDRRQSVIRPTEKADLLFPKMRESFLCVNNNCMKDFSPGEKQSFYSMMERIIKNLSEETNTLSKKNTSKNK
jgi:MarR family transcriptional regulator, transcriptional regulator for hemolysin